MQQTDLGSAGQSRGTSGSPRLTFVGFQLAQDTAASRQLAVLADASGGRVVAAEDAAALRSVLQAGIQGTALRSRGGGLGTGSMPTTSGPLGWVVGLILLNLLLAAAIVSLRVPKLRKRLARFRRVSWPWLALIIAALSLGARSGTKQGGTMQPTPGAYADLNDGPGPVVLVHGIWGDAGTFAPLSAALVQRGWVELPVMRWRESGMAPEPSICGYGPSGTEMAPLCGDWAVAVQKLVRARPDRNRLVIRVQIIPNDGLTFQKQGEIVRRASALVESVTSSRHVRIVAHSMGGLAARAWLQGPNYDGDVSELITVATPHAGSLLPLYRRVLDNPDLERVRIACGIAPNREGQVLVLKALGALVGGDFFGEGVLRLAPDADELKALNAGDQSSVEAYGALPTSVRYTSVVATQAPPQSGDWPILPCSAPDFFRGMVEYYNHVVESSAELYQTNPAILKFDQKVLTNWSDLVVPAASQYLRMVKVGWSVPSNVVAISAHHLSAPAAPELVDLVDVKSSSMAGGGAALLVLDLSGSMSLNNKLPMAKQAAREIVNGLPPDVAVGLIGFGGFGDPRGCSIRRLLPATTDHVKLLATIDGLIASGSTPLLDVLHETAAEVRGQPDPASVRVVVVTDGEEMCRKGLDPVPVARELGIALRIIPGTP